MKISAGLGRRRRRSNHGLHRMASKFLYQEAICRAMFLFGLSR
ncbi:hypothetical protein SS05631_c09600 [Sinorhizobium sp. CCBAU 05631]|nr:hypothetical protein SS05631_c09600 [Sinorhizobium sp. CCBAU 05631]